MFGTVHPLVTGKAGDRDGAQCCFFFQKFAAQKFADLPGILTVELIVSVLLKAYQRIRVLFLQSVVLGGGIQRQQCRAFLCLAVIVLQFLVCDADQFRKIQSLQFGFGQIFQTFVLPLVDQHLAQIPFHPVSHQIHINLNGNILIGGVGVGNADLGQVRKVRFRIIFLQTEIPDQVFGMSQGSIWFYGDGHRGRVMLLLLIRQVAVGLNHQVDILFHLCPFQGDFLVVRIVVKFQPLPVVVYKTPAAVQKIVGVPTDAVFLCQRLGTEVAVRLDLVQCHNTLLATLKPGAVLAQFVLNFRLR